MFTPSNSVVKNVFCGEYVECWFRAEIWFQVHYPRQPSDGRRLGAGHLLSVTWGPAAEYRREGHCHYSAVEKSRRVDMSRSECIGGIYQISKEACLLVFPASCQGGVFLHIPRPGFCHYDGGWYPDNHVTYAYDITSTSHHSLTARTQRDLWTHGPLVHISTHIYISTRIYAGIQCPPSLRVHTSHWLTVSASHLLLLDIIAVSTSTV